MSELPAAEDLLVGFVRFAGHRAARRLMQEHLAGADGRCPICRADGASSGHVVAPCNLYSAARIVRKEAQTEADRRHVEQVTGGPVGIVAAPRPGVA